MLGPRSPRGFMILAASLLGSCLALAQQQPVQPINSRNADDAPAARKVAATEPAEEVPNLSEEQKLAFQTLEASEGASRGFEAPMRSYSLLQIGSTFVTLDAGKARQLLREAFTASLEIQDTDVTRPGMQRDIFQTLLPLSQPDVEELLPRAEPWVRNSTTAQLVDNYAGKKQFEKGMELIRQIAAVDEFPYEPASHLIGAMPAEMAAEKLALFSEAVASFKNHAHPGVYIGGATLTGMVTRVGLTMPPKLVLQAMDEILSQAKAKADSNISLAGMGGRASFANEYQYQLFTLLPTLRKLDEERAKQLLEENQELQAKLQQFPDGMNSLMPPPPPAGAKSSGTNASDAKNAAGNGGSAPPVTNVQDYLRRDERSKMEAIALEAESDPVQAIAHTMTLPSKLDDGSPQRSPRASALESIARANVKKNPGGAESALAELRKIIADLQPGAQVPFLSAAADLYLQMNDKDEADKVVSEGFKVADRLLEMDTDPNSPNEALKAWWPSTDAYRRFVEVETRISNPATLNVLKEIKDPEIRTTESIMFARSLLGLPLKRFTVVEKRGRKTSSSTFESN
jgi:hypothetical protein